MSNIEIALTCNWPRNISQAIGWRGGAIKLSARSADSLSARIEALQCSRGQAVRAPGLEGLADSFNGRKEDTTSGLPEDHRDGSSRGAAHFKVAQARAGFLVRSAGGD